jgi:hypothetical protein
MPAASQEGEQRERRRRGDKKKCFGFGEKDILKFLEILQLLLQLRVHTRMIRVSYFTPT